MMKTKLMKKLIPNIGRHEEIDDVRKTPFQDITHYYSDDISGDFDYTWNDVSLVELILEDRSLFPEMQKNCFIVGSSYIYIPPNTVHAKVNELYRGLIDYCDDQQFEMSVINPEMKNAFYKFCAKYT